MKTHVTLLLLFLVLSLFLMSGQLFAQESVRDTFRINNVVGNPGDIIAVKLFVVNDSASLGAFNAAVRIDTNYVRFVGEFDFITITWFPFYVFLVLLLFSSSTLYFNKKAAN